MRPGPLSRPLLRTLPVLGFILVLLGMFQNFDIKDIEEFSRLQQQNQPRPIGATSLGGAAEELFVTRYAPEALEFRDRLGERMHLRFTNGPHRMARPGEANLHGAEINPEVELQVIGSQGALLPQLQIINADRVRMKWENSTISCEYAYRTQTLQFRAPLNRGTNLQIEHGAVDKTGRLSLQFNW